MGERQGGKRLVLFMILPQLAARTAAATTEGLKRTEQEVIVGRMEAMEKSRSVEIWGQ